MATADGVVIVGAGQAGFQVASSLRDLGYGGAIHLVGDEAHPPYQRPPLSKRFLTGDVQDSGVHFRPVDFFENRSVTMHLGCRATAIDRTAKELKLSGGERLAYSHLVLATGARARWLPFPGAERGDVFALRGLDDAKELRSRLGGSARFVVVGGGFIGMEFAAAVRKQGFNVTVVEPAGRVMERAISEQLSIHLVDEHARRGVVLMTGRGVSAIHGNDDGTVSAVETDDGRWLDADAVLIAIGAVPNTELAEDAGLLVDGGIVVGETLLTSDPHISAIGDCCIFPMSGRSIRLESVQNASDQARFVATRLVEGGAQPYVKVPWFWTHQYDMKIQLAGIGGPTDETVTVGDRASGAFSVLRFTEGWLSCVESVNRPADHMAARTLLATDVRPSVAEAQVLDFELKNFVRAVARR
ncbi:FAD-dependent oxidoreductase [Mycolicibacterium sp. 120266]|uniref:NAD(P)/FAD-dependent oxidoreductase n=1 Tax=Mycolicibacterium sp. 120266 TaxID=3090601 RepID=UPI00299D8E51|nr:FAD-dependent oxidoreductase [Mycolicibacterium sp. 120266]MDX1876179.1 FAD-dependent oxidoreductase [Mycolicibacterium sp. 120266]